MEEGVHDEAGRGAQALSRDLMGRQFPADAPRQLWVTDIKSVTTKSGFAYVEFVTDVKSRRIVGWNVAATVRGGAACEPGIRAPIEIEPAYYVGLD